jgi:uracil-DNA glycosylase
VKPLVVGLAPTRDDGTAPFAGPGSGTRLARLLGRESWRDVPDVADVVNLSPVPVAGRLPAAEGRLLATRLDVHGRVVVACGRTVAAALGVVEAVSWGTAVVAGGALVLVIPHPSGRARPYNDPILARHVQLALVAARLMALVGPPYGEWTEADARAVTGFPAAMRDSYRHLLSV